MVSRKTISVLSSARNHAEQAGLEGTAQRLESLRRELRSMHALPPPLKLSRARWARANVEETKKGMARELEHPDEIKERQDGKEILAITTKIMLVLDSGFSALVSLFDSDHKILGGSAYVIGTIIAAGLIDHLIGPKNAKEAMTEISLMLDEVKAGING